ncbi:unnamed protein product [Brassicogethes aeneus]|uniref:G-protein coupled receptors family 1 profile domain-containing protein n=1 Tax=Brassicogethes aeneus TaxID=1431903 RepID=A0A9P0B652_BRAAE|nr:unnamed protein product [Brassicogethes aeneus]
MNNTTVYCDFRQFSRSYEEIHGPLSFLVCVFGSIANILNICVLSTKEMRWPTNLILTGLAVADLLVMLEYIPFTVHRYLDNGAKNQIFHFISCVLTVILAIWRYIIITNPQNSNAYCSMKQTFYVIVATYIVCPIICSPLFLSLKILSYNQTCEPDGRIINKEHLHLFNNTESSVIYYTDYISDTYKQSSFWIYGVVIKLVPCILLTHLSRRIISVLLETKRRRKLLMNGNVTMNSSDVRPVLSKKLSQRSTS